MRAPISKWLTLLLCTTMACGSRSNLGDPGVTSTVGGTPTTAATSVAGSAIQSSAVSAGGNPAQTTATGIGGWTSLGGTTTKGTTSAQTGGTKTSNTSTNAAGGVTSPTGGTNSTGGSTRGKSGESAIGGTSRGYGGSSPIGATSRAAAGAGGQSGAGGQPGTTVGIGGVAGSSTASGGTGGSVTTTGCNVTEVRCGVGASATCTDTSTDEDNCGQCGNRCPDGATCWSGSCEPPRCPSTFKLGALPTVDCDRDAAAFAVGDLNGDGALDLATANGSAGTLSVLLGNGNGTFKRRTDYPAGKNPLAIAVLDLDRDGKLDLVTANYAADSVSVLLGNGDGTFGPTLDYPVGHGPVAIASGDFDADGFTDIATANNDAGTVSVLHGAGHGTFVAHVDYEAGDFPTAIFAADLSDDGKIDLATTTDSTVTVLLGIGDGSFIRAPESVTGVGGVGAAALGDANGDGNLDLIVGRRSGRYSSGVFGVLFGAGDGSFSPIVQYVPTSAATCRAVGVADLDGDDKVDLVMSDGRQAVSVFSFDSNGMLTGEVTYPTPAPPDQVVLADFNADGWLDVATLDRWGIYVMMARGQGRFDYPERPPTGAPLNAVLLRDLNGDGWLDLAATATGVDVVSVLLGFGDGTFASSNDYPTSHGQGLIDAGDLDGDGYLELVTANGDASGVSVLWNAGDATFTSQTQYATATPVSFLALGDLNGDGKLDILTASDALPENSAVTVLLNQGNGTFATDTYYDAVPLEKLALVDLNHDSKLDLVQTNGEQNGLSVRVGLGDGSFGRTLKSSTNQRRVFRGAAFGDINGDGHLDLVSPDDNVLFNVLLGIGDGTFTETAPQFGFGSYDADRIELADMNGDGKLDAVAHGLVGWVGFEMIVMLGAGDGTLSCSTAGLVDASDHANFALGDVNGDKRIDLVFPNSESTGATVLLNQAQ